MRHKRLVWEVEAYPAFLSNLHKNFHFDWLLVIHLDECLSIWMKV